ncbi:DUF1579 family protein [Motilibacter deserti]|uniref:DUF1579 domain-containing protein n=1 Tax=Motilibacter deserti TaxID=2714956 RepID=A0ABX0GY14_9ACTN|nr:DUF1579 family protein [Motilibacter deserti]NHC15490.1 DUF1579 domain-containing protein [Motilibacter deserti]
MPPALPDEGLLRMLQPLIGRWRTTGRVLDANGRQVATVEGSDSYRWMPGRRWVVHEVDVTMGGEHVQVLEMIGGAGETPGTIAMRAFDASGDYGVMSLAALPDGALLLSGDGVRSVLRPAADGASMRAHWEQEAGPDRWVPWMEMEFARIG